VYPERELLPPQVRAFVDTVIAWAPNIEAISRNKPTRPKAEAKQAKPKPARQRKRRAKA
jgi:hypothetical protein